jgi:hypothetical protein
MANVALGVVTALGARIAAPTLVTAGYLAPERPEPVGYDHRERRELDGWAADLFVRSA